MFSQTNIEGIMPKSFIITGYGRVGTKFLSTVLNGIDGWRVMHEPRGQMDLSIRSLDSFNAKLYQFFETINKYGEVNSGLKFCLPFIPVDKKGIILREPKEVYLSVINRRNELNNEEAYYIFREYSTFLSWLSINDIIFISFRKMVSDSYYLSKIANEFMGISMGIDDVLLKKKINRNRSYKYENYSNLPPQLKESWESFDWSKINHVINLVDTESKPVGTQTVLNKLNYLKG
jgi:hypothetical protein